MQNGCAYAPARNIKRGDTKLNPKLLPYIHLSPKDKAEDLSDARDAIKAIVKLGCKIHEQNADQRRSSAVVLQQQISPDEHERAPT